MAYFLDFPIPFSLRRSKIGRKFPRTRAVLKNLLATRRLTKFVCRFHVLPEPHLKSALPDVIHTVTHCQFLNRWRSFSDKAPWPPCPDRIPVVSAPEGIGPLRAAVVKTCFKDFDSVVAVVGFGVVAEPWSISGISSPSSFVVVATPRWYVAGQVWTLEAAEQPPKLKVTVHLPVIRD